MPCDEPSAARFALSSLSAGYFAGDSTFGGPGCSGDGTTLGGRVDSSIALRGPTASDNCVLGVATTAVSGGVSTLIDWGPSPFSSNAQSAQQTTRSSQARAVRLTVDHADVSPRMIRVYYSPDSNFSQLVEVLSVAAPPELASVTEATVGFGGISVSMPACCCSYLHQQSGSTMLAAAAG